MKLINILFVDSYTLFSQALMHQLSEEPEFYLLPLARSNEEIKKTSSKEKIDIVLLSNLKNILKNIEIVRMIKLSNKKAKFVLLSHWYSDYLMAFSIKSGINALITNSVNVETLISVIKELTVGTHFFCPIYSIKNKKSIIEPLSKEELIEIKRMLPVTKKQLEIINLFVQGYTPKDTAKKLNISLKTINNHKRNIALKNNLKTHFDIIRLGISMGIDPHDRRNILDKRNILKK